MSLKFFKVPLAVYCLPARIGGRMKQKVIKSIHGLIDAGELALAGAREVGDAAGLPVGTAVAVEREFKELVAAHGEAEKANVALDDCSVALEKAKEVAFGFATESRDFAKRTLGYRHSEVWVSMGYPKSLKVPKSSVKLIPLLETTVMFLKKYPEQEVASRGITAVRAGEVLKALIAARNGYVDAKANLMGARKVRRMKARQVKRRRSFLVSQLKFTLDPVHEYWMRFGLNQPGAKSVPAAPRNVVIEMVDEESAKVMWDRVPGAERYEVVVKVMEEASAVGGSHPAAPAVRTIYGLHLQEQGAGAVALPDAVALPPDIVNAGHQTVMRQGCDFVIKPLPAKGRLEVAVSALNEAGRSKGSRVVVEMAGGAGPEIANGQ
jgi:hypothetical protein